MSKSRLRSAIIELFKPQFAPHAKFVYMKRTRGKSLIADATVAEKLKLPCHAHEDLPDVILYVPRRRWLYLVECGAISVERRQAFEKVFGDAVPHRIYVSAFSDFGEFGRKGDNITWGTEAWIAEVPNHLIHFDSSKLLARKSFMKNAEASKTGAYNYAGQS